jgi:hypothetical protein
MFFGSGGGVVTDYDYPNGGDGGGILFIAGRTINFGGSLTAKGSNRPHEPGLYGGTGAGGSIRVEGYDVNLNAVNVSGGSPGQAGAGGRGRIAVYYENSFSGSFTPNYLQKQDTGDRSPMTTSRPGISMSGRPA